MKLTLQFFQQNEAKRRILNQGSYQGSQLIMFSNIFFQNGQNSEKKLNLSPQSEGYQNSMRNIVLKALSNNNSTFSKKYINSNSQKMFNLEDEDGYIDYTNFDRKEKIYQQAKQPINSSSQSFSSNSEEQSECDHLSENKTLINQRPIKKFSEAKIVLSTPPMNHQLPLGKTHRKSIFNLQNQAQSEEKSIHLNKLNKKKNKLTQLLNKSQQQKKYNYQNRVFNPKKAKFLFDHKKNDKNKIDNFDFLSEEELVHEDELDMKIPANGSRRMNLNSQHNRRYSRMGLSKNNQLSLLSNKRLIWGSSLVSFINKN